MESAPWLLPDPAPWVNTSVRGEKAVTRGAEMPTVPAAVGVNLSPVIAGHKDARERAYAPAIHPLNEALFPMDARVKPAHDDFEDNAPQFGRVYPWGGIGQKSRRGFDSAAKSSHSHAAIG